MALFWQLRRMYRQRMRGAAPNKPINYHQMARRRVIVTFVFFFIGWKAFGMTLNDWLLFRRDAVTGEFRFHTPDEVKSLVELKKRQVDPKFIKQEFAKTVVDTGFSLDSD
ncbi:hypothetical protein QR680_010346 [Steinernema hermaphroditum]|uniref:Uncharacterized protein n=1 Tax=Steinernema hermaphroditum TaxID=289476 RepID=A0AA39MB26_9BILA|nr:hypothetical protein QR680_010346 [Steinernema hermaphroditum]